LISRCDWDISKIHVTLDSHHVIDVGHPTFWLDIVGNHPKPFTVITFEDYENKVWLPYSRDLIPRMREYLKKLGKMPVWPEHCLIGTPGHNVEPKLLSVLQKWTRSEFSPVNFVWKGLNPYTEHYGAIEAEVPDEEDSHTLLDIELLEELRKADRVIVGGQASSHCVLTTMNQIVKHIGTEYLSKFILLTDCMSPVGALPGADFPAIASAWQKEMGKTGMKLATSVEMSEHWTDVNYGFRQFTVSH
jgi:nicotinamidase-related amidase